MEDSSYSATTSPTTSRLRQQSRRGASRLPPSTPSGRQSFAQLTFRLRGNQDTQTAVREQMSTSMEIRKLRSSVPDLVQLEYQAARDDIESTEYRAERARDIPDETLLRYESRMHLVVKQNLELLLAEIHEVDLTRSQLPRRPVPVNVHKE